MTTITIADLTTATIDGSGVFDTLMKANKAHLDAEYSKDRIKGAEYATVYLGSLESVMNTALQFLLQREKIGLEAQLMALQVDIAQLQKEKTMVELEMLRLSLAKVPAEIAVLEQQTTNMRSENLGIVAKTAQTTQQTQNLQREGYNIPRQGLLLDGQVAQVTQQTANLLADNAGIVAKTGLTQRQTANAVFEGDVLQSQNCKLKAEFDLTKGTVLKVAAETTLLDQKTVSEKAQTLNVGVDDNSVIGRQKLLYKAQTDGFQRDAEQKAAKLMVDTWNVRRTTDEGTVADGTNLLNDAAIGRAVSKMLAGINA